MQISEQNVRRLAAREGYVLRKSRSRNPDDPSFGGYILVDSQVNIAVLGAGPYCYSADLDEIHDWLTE